MLKPLTVIILHILLITHSWAYSCINRPVQDIQTIASAIELYRLECSSDPVSIIDLISTPDQAARECNHGFLPDIPKDPWGETYRLLAVSSGLFVSSAGPDSTWQSNDDIVGVEEMEKSYNFKCEDPLKMTWQDYIKFFAGYGMIVVAGCSIFFFRKRLFRLLVK